MARKRRRRKKQSDKRKLSEHYRLAADEIALDDDLEGAIGVYQQATAIDDSNADALVGLGDSYMASELSAKAFRAYKQALKVHPRHAQAHAALADFLARHGYLKQATRAQERAVECDPDHAYLSYRLARLYAFSGNFDRAEEQLGVAIKLDGEEALYHYRLGEWRARRGDWKAARTAYANAARHSPLDDFYLVRLAGALIRLNLRSLALRALKRAVRIAPDNRAHRYLLGELMILTGSLESGNEQVRLVGELDEYDREYIRRAKLRSGQLDEDEELITLSPIEVPT